MLEFTRVFDIPRYISHTYIKTWPFRKGYPKVVTSGHDRGRSPESRSSVLFENLGRLSAGWRRFGTVSRPAQRISRALSLRYSVCTCVYVCVLRQRTLRYKFRSLALRGVDLHPNPNPRNPRCCNFYSATRGVPECSVLETRQKFRHLANFWCSLVLIRVLSLYVTIFPTISFIRLES